MRKDPKKLAGQIMDVQAVYCNDVQFSLNNLGLRLTFGESSIMADEPPVHRVAVFLPTSVVDAFLQGLTAVKASYNEQQAAAQAKKN